MYHKNYLTTIVLTFFFGSSFMPSLGMMSTQEKVNKLVEGFCLFRIKKEEGGKVINGFEHVKELTDERNIIEILKGFKNAYHSQQEEIARWFPKKVSLFNNLLYDETLYEKNDSPRLC